MQRISEQLQQALTEATIPNNESFMKTLNSLAKQGGTWKSEKQARFILDKAEAPRWRASPPALKAAKAHKMGGEYVLYLDTMLQGFGRKTTSKVRYTARLYTLDGGGVVAIAKVPIDHAKQSSQGFIPKWDDAEIVFRRTKKPTIIVDPRGERKAAAKENAPMIAKLKMIPDWEEKDIIVSFLGQLEAGKKLSVKQMGIANNMLPPELVERGNVAEWKAKHERFQQLMADKLLPALNEKAKEELDDYEDISGYYTDPIKQYKSMGYAKEHNIALRVIERLAELTKSNIGSITLGTDGAKALHKQMLRALKPKPTKKALAAVDFILKAVDVMESKPKAFWKDYLW